MGSELIEDIDLLLPLYDSREYTEGGCTCDFDVNHQCELCVTYSTLLHAKQEIERLTAVEDHFRKFVGFTATCRRENTYIWMRLMLDCP